MLSQESSINQVIFAMLLVEEVLTKKLRIFVPSYFTIELISLVGFQFDHQANFHDCTHKISPTHFRIHLFLEFVNFSVY